MGNSDNVIGYIEYLSDDGKIIGYRARAADCSHQGSTRAAADGAA